MNILFTVSYYLPYISGITVHANRLADALTKRGKVVTVVTSQFDKKLLDFELDSGVRIVRVPVKIKLHKGFIMPSYFFRIWREIDEADLVVSHLPQFEAVFAAVLAKLKKKKYYVIYHCEVNLPKKMSNTVVEMILHTVHFVCLILSDKIVTYTKDYARNSTLLPKFLNKTVYIYPPIPSLTNKNRFKKMNITRSRKIVIGVAARVANEKGIEFLLLAIPYLREKLNDRFIIRFAGSRQPAGEKAYEKRLQPLIDKYSKYISFAGTIKPKNMQGFYKNLDVLVLPSVNKTEAFGMVQVEAMMSGVPVIASDLPGVRVPVLVTGMGELSTPGDPKSIADKILLILHNKQKYSKKSSELVKIFSYENTISKYEAVFNVIS